MDNHHVILNQYAKFFLTIYQLNPWQPGVFEQIVMESAEMVPSQQQRFIVCKQSVVFHAAFFRESLLKTSLIVNAQCKTKTDQAMIASKTAKFIW